MKRAEEEESEKKFHRLFVGEGRGKKRPFFSLDTPEKATRSTKQDWTGKAPGAQTWATTGERPRWEIVRRWHWGGGNGFFAPAHGCQEDLSLPSRERSFVRAGDMSDTRSLGQDEEEDGKVLRRNVRATFDKRCENASVIFHFSREMGEFWSGVLY